MGTGAQTATSYLRVACALCLVHAIVTIPWAAGNWGLSLPGLVLLACWLAAAAVAVPIARETLSGRRYWILLVVALAVARLGPFLLVSGATVVGDPGIYEQLARSLLGGEGLIFRDPLTQVDFRALYPPAYPLFLAAIGRFVGLSADAFWASNLAIDFGSALLLMGVGTRLGSPAAGRAAAWLFAIWPAFAFASPFAQKESMVTLEVLAVSFVLLGLHRAHITSWREAALLGLAAACLMLTQPALALFPAILGLVLLRTAGWRPLASLLLKAAPFALLLVAPWWIRNFHLFGSFVPLTTTGGLSLWVGNNRDATGNWMPMPDAYRGMPEVEMSARAAREAARWMADNPGDFIRLTFFKLFRAVGMEQFTLARLNQMTPQPHLATFAALFPLLQGSFIALLAAAALFAKRLPRLPRGNRLLLILCACAAQILLFSLPFEFGERHRWFLMPFLFLAVAAGLVRPERAPHRPSPST
jgi:hypothetical protein